MRFSSSTFFVFFLILTSLMGTSVWASDPAKKPEVKEEPKINYVEEAGELGRRGNVYKRVAKPKFEEPEPVPKAPFPEPPEPPKKEDSGKKEGGQGEPKKDEKKDDGPSAEPKKDEKKKGDGHSGSPGKDAKKPEAPALSAVYDSAVIKLDVNNRPLTPVAFTNAYADYFVCHKTIKAKYRDTVLAEMNTFADRMGLPRAQDMPCMIKVAKANTKFPGSIYIEFYVDDKAEKSCIKKGECGSTRLMMLHPKDKTGKKSQELYRSYVLTDEKKFRRANYCVSPEGQLLGEKHCYVVLNPDWLFN
jgi:hypothetical protein